VAELAAEDNELAAVERILARVETLDLFTERGEEVKGGRAGARGDRQGDGPMRCPSSGTPKPPTAVGIGSAAPQSRMALSVLRPACPGRHRLYGAHSDRPEFR
jgi:hypothetical protein